MPQPKRRRSLGESLLDLFFPTNYEPHPERKPSTLPGWSGLPTDPVPPGWGPSPQHPAPPTIYRSIQ